MIDVLGLDGRMEELICWLIRGAKSLALPLSDTFYLAMHYSMSAEGPVTISKSVQCKATLVRKGQNAVSRYNDGNQIISSEVFLDSFNSR